MCAVSAVGDGWRDRFDPWKDRLPVGPYAPMFPSPFAPYLPPDSTFPQAAPVTRKEFDELKRMVEEMHEELRAAKAKDVAEGTPDCEMEDKVDLLKKIAKAVGVDLSDVFGK